MPTDPTDRRLELVPDLDPPELTAGAAVVLLRILRKEHDRQPSAESGRTVAPDQVVA